MAISIRTSAAKSAQGTVTITMPDFAFTEKLPVNMQSAESSLPTPGTVPNATVTWSTAQAHAGTRSVQFTSTNGTGQIRTYLNSNFGVTPGITYRFSLWVYQTTGAPRTVVIGIDWKNSNGVYTAGLETWTAIPSGVWTSLTHTGTCPTGCIQSTVTFGANPGASGEDFFFDDFSYKQTVSQNDVLVAFVFEQGPTDPTTPYALTIPSGWTRQAYTTNSVSIGMGLGIYTRIADSTESSYSWTEPNFSGATLLAEVVVLSGADELAVVDGVVPAATITAAAPTSQSAPAASPLYNNSFLICGWATGLAAVGAGTYTVPGSMAEQQNAQYTATGTYNMYGAVATQQLSATGSTSTRTATASSANGTTDAYVTGSIAILTSTSRHFGTLGVGR